MEDIFAKKDLIYCIYQEKSFSKAAQKLFISQPSLSLMVKKLEDRIGSPLFDRSSKPIQVTEVGMRYIAAVEQLSSIEQDFEDYLRALNDLEAGSLGIGSNQLLSTLVLPRYIGKFTKEHPNIQLQLLDANSKTLENQITAGQLDILIDNYPLPQEQFASRYLATEHLLLAVPAAFPQNSAAQKWCLRYEDVLEGRHAEAKKAVPPALFYDVPFIMMNRDNDIRRQSDAIFEEVDFEPKILFEMDRLTTLYSYVENGIGASVVSDTLIRNIRGMDQSNICFYPLPTGHASRNIYVSYKRNKYYSRAMASFIDALGDLNRGN